MKKLILTIVSALASMTAATASTDSVSPEPKAVGVRIGWGAELSYQQSMDKGFMEVDLGLDQFNSLDFSTFYNFVLAQPEWTTSGTWGIYAGPGASLGMKLLGAPHFFHISVGCMVGVEYAFDNPLLLSFDIRPQIGVGFGHGFYWKMTPSVGVRYRF